MKIFCLSAVSRVSGVPGQRGPGAVSAGPPPGVQREQVAEGEPRVLAVSLRHRLHQVRSITGLAQY